MNSPNSPAVAAESPAEWRVYHRPRKGRGVRWRLAGTAATFGGAVRLIAGPGDWWLSDRGEIAAAQESSESSESSAETP